MEEVDIRIKDMPVGKVRLDLAEIKGGGSEYDPRFVVPLRIELNQHQPGHQIVIVRLSASLHLGENPDSSNQFASKVSYDLIYNLSMCSASGNAMTYSKEIHFNLTHAQLKALENMRHKPGKALYLNLEPVIVWNKYTGNNTEVVNGKIVSTQGEGGWSTHVGAFSDLALFWFPKIEKLRLDLAAMNWAEKIFPGIGYDNFRLIEVKLPTSSARLVPEDAVGHFKKAMQSYDKGVPEESLRECRLAHEAIEKEIEARLSAKLGRVYNLGREHKLGEAIALDLGWTPGSEQEKFVDSAWKPLYVMANASSHTPSTNSLLPADAHTELLMTAAMLEYLAQLE